MKMLHDVLFTRVPVLALLVLFPGCFRPDPVQEPNSPQEEGKESELATHPLAVQIAELASELCPEPGVIRIEGMGKEMEADVADSLGNLLSQSGQTGWEIVRGDPIDGTEQPALFIVLDGIASHKPHFRPGIIVADAAEIPAFTERLYRSRVLVEMSHAGVPVQSDDLSQSAGPNQQLLQSERLHLQGATFKEMASSRFSLLWKARGRPTAEGEGPAMASYRFEPYERTSLVEVISEDPDPLVAAITANAVAEAASQFFSERNRQKSDSAVQWLERQADIQKAHLVKAEDALLGFRQEHSIKALQTQLKADQQSLLELNAWSLDLEKALLEPGEEEEGEKQIENLAKQKADVSRRVEHMTKRITEKEAQIIQLETRLRILTRERDAVEAGLNSVLNRIEHARVGMDRQAVSVRLLERATIPRKPTVLRIRHDGDALVIRELIPGDPETYRYLLHPR